MSGHAWRAVSRSASTATKPARPALEVVQVVSVRRPGAGSPSVAVFNLTVQGTPEFFANGLLTHNCRYGAMSRPGPSEEPPAVIEDMRTWMTQQLFEADAELVEAHDGFW